VELCLQSRSTSSRRGAKLGKRYYAFMAWFLLEHRSNLTFTFTLRYVLLSDKCTFEGYM
jgi:hypothetical protein